MSWVGYIPGSLLRVREGKYMISTERIKLLNALANKAKAVNEGKRILELAEHEADRLRSCLNKDLEEYHVLEQRLRGDEAGIVAGDKP